MKIILDARKINNFGIGIYLRNLFQGIINSDLFDYKILHLKGTDYLSCPEKYFIETLFKNYDFREHLEIPFKMKKYKDFYFFSPHYVFPIFIKNPLLVAIQDLIHFKFPHLFKPAIKVSVGKFFIKKVKKRARIIFTGSKTTRDDLIEIFGLKKEQIKVIYYGISETFFKTPVNPSPFHFPYIIYVGNKKSHKNLNSLLNAFALIKDRYSDLKLILAGFSKDKTFMETLEHFKLQERVIIAGYLAEEKLIQYIDGSEFFVFPSLYEGFGFPPLEAMARKKAVISSTGGSLKEILSGKALFFNPESYEELAEKISIFMENKELRSSYQDKGYKHCSSFRWKKTVEKYIKELKELD